MLTNSPNNFSAFAGKTTQFCGFEDEQICGFYQEDNRTDSLDWTRGSGSTPSDDTGPSTDHTCGNNFGHYMYVEATRTQRNPKALLTSPHFRGMDDQCVEFFYHMYGRHIGTLNVFSYVDDAELSPLWRAYGNQGNVWSTARMTIPRHVAKKGYKVVFEAALLQTGYQGDIAIDDFRVTDGKCVRPTRDASQIDPRRQRRRERRSQPGDDGGAV
ncbi:hypothetical protein NP493_941g00005 [Ridgeia piscesae]|uniref:MAM domain-containing protein n=1 Tax=Ridgeia piscesae TaxID=27915 RepID=A0AAD9NMH4_RIDPI|nr:hypothetical protein NP493_941g00005 [Ridgeia piscesae]